MSRILIIDDETDFSGFLREALEAHLHQIDYVNSALAGLEALANRDFDLILLDNQMPGMTGLEFLAEFRTLGIDIPVIMMTVKGTSEIEIQAWIQGVFDYVEKPLGIDEIDELVEHLEPAIRRAEKRPRNRIPGDEPIEDAGEQLLGKSPAWKKVLRSIATKTEVPAFRFCRD